MKLYTDGEGTYLIRGRTWELRTTKGLDTFEYIVGGFLYEQRHDALHALEIRPAQLTIIDAYWRKIDTRTLEEQSL